MGEEAEYYLEQCLFYDLADELEGLGRDNIKYWKTLKGETLKISDMETSHIKNCIRHCLRREILVPREFYRVLKERGEVYDL
jgi:5'(3')-deoxyribonucleotidase